ncbi:uncharacterized protein LOC135487565 [Lineus longissimus]|uniref:uncharacterized protein LOC135487565 n=1 Tax=Lineus longissimus TaxID=88925 RepID=UPI002B4D1145
MAATESVVRPVNEVNFHDNDPDGFLRVCVYIPPGPGGLSSCCINSPCVFKSSRKRNSDPIINIEERAFSVTVDAVDRSNNVVTYKTEYELLEPLAVIREKSKHEIRINCRNRMIITLLLKKPDSKSWEPHLSCVKKRF